MRTPGWIAKPQLEAERVAGHVFVGRPELRAPVHPHAPVQPRAGEHAPLPCQVRPIEALNGELLSVVSGGERSILPDERALVGCQCSVTVSSE